MILASFLAALGQMTDPRFTSVVWRGVGLALGLLVGLGLALWFGIGALVPDSFSLPFIGQIGGVDTALGLGAVLVLLVGSVFLMVPVAAAFSALFLDEVADAVEARHYPTRPGRALPMAEALADSALIFFVMVGVSLIALLLSVFLGPLAPVLFWALNGWLLGREYFMNAARRHLPRAEARALMARHSGKVWMAGVLMALPLSLPLVSLVIPVLGAATFTHLYQKISSAPGY